MLIFHVVCHIVTRAVGACGGLLADPSLTVKTFPLADVVEQNARVGLLPFLMASFSFSLPSDWVDSSLLPKHFSFSFCEGPFAATRTVDAPIAFRLRSTPARPSRGPALPSLLWRAVGGHSIASRGEAHLFSLSYLIYIPGHLLFFSLF